MNIFTRIVTVLLCLAMLSFTVGSVISGQWLMALVCLMIACGTGVFVVQDYLRKK